MKKYSCSVISVCIFNIETYIKYQAVQLYKSLRLPSDYDSGVHPLEYLTGKVQGSSDFALSWFETISCVLYVHYIIYNFIY